MEVQVIEKKQGRIDRTTGLQINEKLKVAAYARVSTDSEDQLNSFESQVKYYNEKISKNMEWSFIEVYADESISGTQDYKRNNFMRMIQDSMNGKIDLILTKSISRFARNTLDTLKYVRMLKEKNVAILFEEENINTLEMAGELLLTILSSVAQQESETISSHVKLGLKMKQQIGEQILEKRAGSRSKGKRRGNYSRKYPFSSRIYCGFCGIVLTRRNWNSKTKNETPVWHCMNFVKRGKQECPKCKAMKEKIIENCFVDAYKILCSNKGDIVNKFITRINSIITENSSSKLIGNIENEKEKLKSKMNKLIDLSLENAIDREKFLERKEKMQNQIEQLNLKQEKLVLDEKNKTNRKLSLNKLKQYLENGEIITEFDKDAFEILVKQVIIGGYDKKDKADPKQVTFVLKNESKVNYEDYLQTSNDIHEKNLQMSDHTCGVLLGAISQKLDTIVEFTDFEDFVSYERKRNKNFKQI